MFEGFVNPALVAGAGLASVPLLIHLFNRQRYKPMEWAAMRFVLAAYKKTRRRVQLENLLLLLLRMGAIALSAVVTWAFGSMIWGVFPTVGAGISWEGHLFGFLGGVLVARVLGGAIRKRSGG